MPNTFRTPMAVACLTAGLQAASAQDESFRIGKNDVPFVEASHIVRDERMPDQAMLSVSFSAKRPTTGETYEALKALVVPAIADLTQLGIADTDVSTSLFRVEANVLVTYRDGAEIIEERRQDGYVGTYVLKVRVRDLAKVANVTALLSRSGGAMDMNAIVFSCTCAAAWERQMSEQAVAGAAEDARRMIAAAGGRPGRILSITSSSWFEGEADLPMEVQPEDGISSEPLPILPAPLSEQTKMVVRMEILQ